MTSPMTTGPATAGRLLPGPLALALEEIDVDVASCSLDMDGRRHEAGNPAALRALLRDLLYFRLHAGRQPEEDGTELPPELPGTGRERAFDRRIASLVPHETSRATARLLADDGGDSVLVHLGGVKVSVARERLRTIEPGADAVVEVDMPAVRPWLSPGFFLVSGSRGAAPRTSPVRRLYVHLTEPEAAFAVWPAVLQTLESLGALYRAKVLSRASHYPRCDALVVYLGERDAGLLPVLADAVAGLPGIGEETSLFASRLAPGVATACEPADRRAGWAGLSFGQHRAAAVATGLIRFAAGEAESREAAVHDALLKANVVPSAPWSNAVPEG
jgi:hypothetical protein